MSAASGALRAAEVEVAQVRFAEQRDAAGQVWWGAAVDLEVDATGGGAAGRFTGEVAVELQWGVERAEAPNGVALYRARSRTAALEEGRARFRFYLPPTLVRRDQVERAPRFWAVQVTVEGEVLADSRRSVGEGISSPEALANFRRGVAQQAEANDGVLLPWYLTPFLSEGRGEVVTPVPMRSENIAPLAAP
ncbi:hypothetical protein [Actomonas aquatica]|uniref:VIT domain-containing protein n=1 Tax=Actomonas aquatica TaxID=2866162 RepID=A0ABZ1C8C3_9BACT|nr:hypothetical protein [Opitutus sp. WL0086]WRQ87723.1 hypothetical protein K1X11_023170 [Opitutus sp. WL0086]